MGKGRLTALLLAIVIIGLGIMRTATASHDESHKAFSGGAGFKGLVVKTDRDASVFTTAVLPDWEAVDSRGFEIPAGESQLIVVDFFAEAGCAAPSDSGSCSIRAVVGTSLNTAQALEPAVDDFGFAHSAVGVSQGLAMSRALCVRNASASPVNVSVWLQASTTGEDVVLQIDDWTFKIARNAPCSPFVDIR